MWSSVVRGARSEEWLIVVAEGAVRTLEIGVEKGKRRERRGGFRERRGVGSARSCFCTAA